MSTTGRSWHPKVPSRVVGGAVVQAQPKLRGRVSGKSAGAEASPSGPDASVSTEGGVGLAHRRQKRGACSIALGSGSGSYRKYWRGFARLPRDRMKTGQAQLH